MRRNHPGKTCDSPPKPLINWNPLTWIGVEKKPQTVSRPRTRAQLVDGSAAGYRAPAEGAGVKIDNN